MAGVKGMQKAPNSMKSGPHLSVEEREAGKIRIAHLIRRGYTQAVIAEELGITPGRVSQVWKQIKQEWKESHRLEDVEAHINSRLEQLAETKMEAWKAWERSKEDARRVEQESFPVRVCAKCEGKGKVRPPGPTKVMVKCVRCSGTGETGGPGRANTITEGRLPGAEYLKVVVSCLKEEAELLALYPERTLKLKGGLNNSNVNAFVDWNDMMRMLEGGTPDVVEAKIAGLLDGSATASTSVDQGGDPSPTPSGSSSSTS